eukprot:9323860-Pyramimonas_sp.AAC.1
MVNSTEGDPGRDGLQGSRPRPVLSSWGDWPPAAYEVGWANAPPFRPPLPYPHSSSRGRFIASRGIFLQSLRVEP